MKLALMVSALNIMANVIVAQNRVAFGSSDARLEFGGQIVRVMIWGDQTDPQYSKSSVTIRAKLFLKNRDKTSLILLSSRPICQYVAIAPSSEALNDREERSLYNLFQSARFIDSNQWGKYKESLDKDIPPDTRTTILAPESTITFDDEIDLHVPIGNDQVDKNQFLNQKTLNELKAMPSIYLRLEKCSVTGEAIDPSLKAQQHDFYEHIRSRWAKHGYLLLDDIMSEPFLFNLESPTIKK